MKSVWCEVVYLFLSSIICCVLFNDFFSMCYVKRIHIRYVATTELRVQSSATPVRRGAPAAVPRVSSLVLQCAGLHAQLYSKVTCSHGRWLFLFLTMP